MNDPNGLVYVGGVWHAYFQYNPEGIGWGNMSWGHATSTDLAQWHEHPVAMLYRAGEQIYSGSVVADHDGTLTAFYTSAYASGIQAQSRAISNDGGTSWAPDPDNPVLERGSTDFRDPKVVRYVDADGRTRWILVAVEAVERRVLFYASTDLHRWELTGSFGPIGPEGVVWECPDLVQLTLDGNTADKRWVLLLSTNPVGAGADATGSAMHYLVGTFDGHSFTPNHPILVRADYGRDFYAGVTFDSAPGGAAIMLAWMSNWRYAHDVPSTPWRGAMSLPRHLSLGTINGAPRLIQRPASFIDLLLTSALRLELASGASLTVTPHSLIELRWDPGAAGSLHVRIGGEDDATAEIVHDPHAATLAVSRTGSTADALHPDFSSTSVAPLHDVGNGRLLVSIDGPLLEIFAGAGDVTQSNLVTIGGDDLTMNLSTERLATVTVNAVDVSNSSRRIRTTTDRQS